MSSPFEAMPVANEEYDTVEYWNKRYQLDDEFEWCKEYIGIKDLLHKHIRRIDSILMLGCGNSLLSSAMYEDGYHSITNVDYSPVVISKMSSKFPQMKWIEMDMLNLTFPDSTFDIVIEKATLDVLFVNEKSPWSVSEEVSNKVDNVLKGVSSVLTKPNGKFISITFAQPHFRRKHYEKFWSDCKYETFGDGFHYYFYTNAGNK